jgi:enediyne biosynthesis protein E4
MGVDAADYDRSGRESLIIGNFSNEMMALYHNEGTNLFIDEAPTSTIGQASLLSLTFGCFFFDYDLDGLVDIFAANGHVADDINRVQPKVTYAQAPHLFHNMGNKHFEEANGGPALKERMVARGAAYADFDNDGDLDIVIATNNGPAKLLRNDRHNNTNALRVALIGTKSNRSAIGARVIATLQAGGTVRAMVKSGSSYLSQSELPLTFGLGSASKVAALEIQWPSGAVEKIGATDGNQTITVEEGKGIVKRTPFVK